MTASDSSKDGGPEGLIENGQLRGRVVSGKGEAAGFTKLPWVRQQVAARLGFDLYPGTLNLDLHHPEDVALWAERRERPGIPLEPAPGFCAARCYPVTVEAHIARSSEPRRIRAAIVLPLVPGYSEQTVEVIAPVGLRAALDLHDGSVLTLALIPVIRSSPSLMKKDPVINEERQ